VTSTNQLSHRALPYRRGWLALGSLVIIVGAVSAFIGATAVAHSDVEHSHDVARSTASAVTSSLKLSIQHEQDLAAGAGAFITDSPHATDLAFSNWLNQVQAFTRYPEVQGVAEVALVPKKDLSSFIARERLSSGNPTLKVTGAPFRGFYCLVAVEQQRSGPSTLPLGFNLCDTQLGPAFFIARDTGLPAYISDTPSRPTSIAAGTPIYRGGAVPSTPSARRAAFIGWTGTQITPHLLLADALAGYRGVGLVLKYTSTAAKGTFHAGYHWTNPTITAVTLHNGWNIQILTAPISRSIFANSNSLILLLSAVLLSLLLGILLYVLGTSRSRAMHLVSERTEQLEHQSLHDPLTGLPNRSLILDRIERMILRGRREPLAIATLFLDIDNFKDINDTLGHRAGDALLVSMGNRLVGAVRSSDTVGRLGGDEFVVLAEGSSLDAGVDVVAARILDAMASPFTIAGSVAPIHVTVSIGIAEGDHADAESFLQDADIALYRAKATGKQRAVTFLPSMQEAVDATRSLELDLQGALEANQFFLMYQPTVDLSTGVFTSVEALLRWNHPVRGIVQPDDFIPALESSGLIVPVGAWVIHTACDQAAVWRRAGHEISVSVNVSANQLELARLCDDVLDALCLSGLDPSALVLELTETALMHTAESTVKRLQDLRAQGVRIAVDDFGTGYSSLSYLKQFPINILKIDRSFISGVTDSAESAALVHTLVQLGKVLGLETVAEGIETLAQCNQLNSECVDTGQGFLFSRPLSVQDATALITQRYSEHSAPVAEAL
jgi:diguanylate cyclase (GGDEF)-like protein